MEHSEKTSSSDTGTSNSTADWQKKAEVSEQRRKDTQSMLTPVQQENARLRAENEVLQTQSVGHSKVTLDSATTERLDDLKFSDPDAWRKEVNQLEFEASKQNKKNFDSAVEEKLNTHIGDAEREVMKQTATAFFDTNTDLDPATFDDLIPAGLQKQVKAGKITIDEFLAQGAAAIRNAPIASASVPNSPDIGAVAGSSEPSANAVEKQTQTDWAHAIV